MAEFAISCLRELGGKFGDRLRDYVKTREKKHGEGSDRAELHMKMSQGAMLVKTAMLVALRVVSQCHKHLHAPHSGISPNSNADNNTAQCSPGQCTPTECHLCKPRRGKDRTAATFWCLHLVMPSRHQIVAWRDHGDQQTPDGCQRIWSGTMLSTLRALRWCMHLGQGQRRQSRPSRQTKWAKEH